ncbi:MAG: Lrp/AsnC family transcriptional regulator [Thaumarchaeota archaeon]|nr:Lrp/AsnC family transcriptional regulator [Nitrososphaerota archaeon]
MSVDDADRRILEVLKEDARIPFVELAKKVGLSEATVRRRVRSLVSRGIIKKFTIELGLEEGAKAMTLVSVSSSKTTPEVAEALKKLKGVETVYEITGQYDVVAIVSGSNIAEINKYVDEIRKIDGVEHTNTIIIMRVVT